MHQLHRRESPSCLNRHQHTSGNDWQIVSSEDKTEIWEALQVMQLDRCAYCESKSDGIVAIRHNLAPADQHRAEETIRVFNLNAASLKNRRRQAVQGYLSLAEEQSELSNTEWREYIKDELEVAAGSAFVTAIRHMLTEPDAQPEPYE
jgi:hypothetical protein